MKYYLIAGEKSGDKHAALLMSAIRERDAQARFRFWGGEDMIAAGGEIVKHISELAFMGFWEVAKNITTISGNIKYCKNDIEAFQPDVLILVDYPGFNLRIAKFASKKGVKVAYYISPKVWAWKESRVKQLRKYVDELMLILPFEQKYFEEKNVRAKYVGNPSHEEVALFREAQPNPVLHFPATVIALLPGSRKQELEKMLPIFSDLAKHFDAYEFVIAGLSSMGTEAYAEYTQLRNVSVVMDQTFELMQVAKAAVVTSGTATLEIALFNVPQVVVYRTSALSYAIAKRVVKLSYISLVNLIVDRPVVRELIQEELTMENLKAELNRLLLDATYIAKMEMDYLNLRETLGDGLASQNAAKRVVNLARLNLDGV